MNRRGCPGIAPKVLIKLAEELNTREGLRAQLADLHARTKEIKARSRRYTHAAISERLCISEASVSRYDRAWSAHKRT